ncbi:hypothetical protein [Tahibacter amnicola]|uniref:Uncharacterized protein n=1 Tax=Tahibacter amnicola TaxID=2976241 RepID=A0ABY6B9T9_9GAMM|nr:hypothetical protein [Tahibacter amnicola]UXI65893.1 hypothetical protein N4264_14115 [Tahibacter amnicola]
MKTRAALTVIAAALLLPTAAMAGGGGVPTKVVVSARFTPSTIAAGQSTTLSWQARGGDITGCRITGLPGGLQWGGESGAIPVRPTQTTTARVLCSEENGAYAVATPTVTVAQAKVVPESAPRITAAAKPTFLLSPGTATVSYSSIYATGCNKGPTSGSYSRFFMRTTLEVISCWGPGGTTSVVVKIPVLEDYLAAGTESDQARKVASSPTIGDLGSAVEEGNLQYADGDFNNDGNADSIVVDVNDQMAYVILGERDGGSRIVKSIAGVADLEQIQSIDVPAGAAAENIVVTVAQ